MTVVAHDSGLVESIAAALELRRPNQAALEAIAEALDGADHGAELVADLATGVGKTYVAGGLLDYLHEAGVRNVVIVTPGSTIQRKTIANLTPGNPKYLRGLQCNPIVITLDDFERGQVGAALDEPNAFKVFVFTVQSLLRPDTASNRRAHRPHEVLGRSLSDYLRAADDLVVIADEHHVYYSGNAKKFQAAIQDLGPSAMVGLTATPHERTPAEQIVYHYPLAEAIADGYVKIPVLVARRDGAADIRTQLADGLALLDAKAANMRAYCEQTGLEFVQPVFFVVAQAIDEANQIRDMLVGSDMLGSEEQVLLVTSEEPDSTLELLDTLEQPGSPIRAVVSVSMLKEGWDVKNIYVIAAVRAMESQLLTEQILGRGLRLPFGRRTGVGMLDTVEVISHHAFSTLLREAEALLEQTLGDRAGEATAVIENTPGVTEATTTDLTNLQDQVAETAGSAVFTLPGSAGAPTLPVDTGQLTLDGLDVEAEAGETSHTGLVIATVEDRSTEGAATAVTLSTPVMPRQPNGVRIPLFIPRVTIRWERDPFSLTAVSVDSSEALGQRWAAQDAPALIRRSLRATRDQAGETHIDIHDETDVDVAATQQLVAFDSINMDITRRLMQTNAVAATLEEKNAATAIAEAFIKGAGVTKDTPWSKEHGRLATEALVRWIQERQTNSPVRQVAEVTQVRWPEPEERIETQPPADRHLITSSREFQRGYPYSGWGKSFYPVVAFDSYSAEFKLAELLEGTSDVKAYARITNTVPLHIGYTTGAITRTYLPDFIVITADDTRWIVEGKADSEMADPVVVAKRDAAYRWVDAVNSNPDIHDKWAYLLVSETAVRNAPNWQALKAAGQAHT